MGNEIKAAGFADVVKADKSRRRLQTAAKADAKESFISTVRDGCNVKEWTNKRGGVLSISTPIATTNKSTLSPERRRQLDEVLSWKRDEELREKYRKKKRLEERLAKMREVFGDLEADKKRNQERLKRSNRERLAKMDKTLRDLFGDDWKTPKHADTLDSTIANQIAKQPADCRDSLAMLYRAWAGYNGQFFGGELKLPIIVVADLQNQYANCSSRANPCIIRFDRRYLKSLDDQANLDILLHEMIHQAIGQFPGGFDKTQDRKTGGHHKRFEKICNEIARQRGWPNVSSDEFHDLTRAAKYWPPRPMVTKS